MTLVEAMTYAIRNEGFEIVGQRRFVYYLNDLCVFDMIPATRRILTVIVDQGYGRKIISLTQSSFLREVKINEIKTQIVNNEGFQAELVEDVVNSICFALHLIITDESKNAISSLIASLHQHGTRGIANIIGGLYNSSVILESTLLQRIYVNKILVEKRIEAEIREREQAKKAIETLVGNLQFYATRNIANIIGGLYNSSVIVESNILLSLYKGYRTKEYINITEQELELKRKHVANIIDVLSSYSQNIEETNIGQQEITEEQEIEINNTGDIEMVINRDTDEATIELSNQEGIIVTDNTEQCQVSDEFDINLSDETDHEMDDVVSQLSENIVRDTENIRRESTKNKSLLRSLFSIFISD